MAVRDEGEKTERGGWRKSALSLLSEGCDTGQNMQERCQWWKDVREKCTKPPEGLCVVCAILGRARLAGGGEGEMGQRRSPHSR